MGRGSRIRAPALILALSLLAPALAEADFRFEDGVYLGSADLLADWADTMERAREQQAGLDACLAEREQCDRRLRGLHTIIDRARGLSRDRQLRLVNRYVNNRRYRRDRSNEVESKLESEPVRVSNRWSTLVEFMHRGGDCEDYATSKYQLLRELGIPAGDLRVVVVYERRMRAHHAVLAVRQPDGSAWLLDSDDRIHRSHPFGYHFIYALNERSIWDHEMSAAEWSQLIRAQPEESS